MQDEVITETTASQEEGTSNLSENLQAAIWGDKPLQSNAAPEEKPTVTEAKPDVVEEAPIPKEWLKKEFDIEDPAVLKAEREELKKLKEVAPSVAEIKFENEESKKLHELIRTGKKKEAMEIIHQQEQLETYASAEVTKDNAEEIIKVALKIKNPKLTKEEIQFEYQEQYSLPKEPKEPVQKASELDDDFEERVTQWKEDHAEWKTKADRLETKRIIAAKMAQPELESSKMKLVLPDILKGDNQQAEPTQEELEAHAKLKETFLKKAEAIVNDFTGFTAQVKNKDVDYSVKYTPSKEEKQVIGDRMKLFAEKGFDANAILADRWVNKDGTLNEIQLAEDLSRIFMGKNSDQKIAAEAAHQRMEIFFKEKKHTNVSGNSSNGMPETKSKDEVLADAYWNS